MWLSHDEGEAYHKFLQDLTDDDIKSACVKSANTEELERLKEATYLILLNGKSPHPLRITTVRAALKGDQTPSRIRNREALHLADHPDICHRLNDEYINGSRALNFGQLRKVSRQCGLLCKWAQTIVMHAMKILTTYEHYDREAEYYTHAAAVHYDYHRHLAESSNGFQHNRLEGHFHVLEAQKLQETQLAQHHRDCSPPEPEIILEGWLMKRSKKGMQDFRLRRVVLWSNNMLRYEDKDGAQKGRIEIHHGTVVRHFGNKLATEEGRKMWNYHPHGFEIFCEASRRAWYFNAFDLDKLEAWIKALQCMIDCIEEQWDREHPEPSIIEPLVVDHPKQEFWAGGHQPRSDLLSYFQEHWGAQTAPAAHAPTHREAAAAQYGGVYFRGAVFDGYSSHGAPA
eukprot:gnl/MRDRNA2_/MRDRNA2_66437_c0_seq1.p1 gnl/MRDRNA2_/MRDRNA2_66437_c0~~gnl/MRDRNA2_/MRDRNA2_66437_c0_seq1.p1  ORF type:complete len:399 (-),score=65.36 gnl/MRDRNA2_/MRDRNA2_66437_c0_seq1:62-1258(-)